MGKFDFPWEFTSLFLIRCARCEQVKRKVWVFFTMLNLIYNMAVTCFTVLDLRRCIFDKIVLAELNWTVLYTLFT